MNVTNNTGMKLIITFGNDRNEPDGSMIMENGESYDKFDFNHMLIEKGDDEDGNSCRNNTTTNKCN